MSTAISAKNPPPPPFLDGDEEFLGSFLISEEESFVTAFFNLAPP